MPRTASERSYPAARRSEATQTTRGAEKAAQDEKALMWQIQCVARLRGWREYHTYRSTKSMAGYPDLTLVRPPRVLFLEVKREDGRVSPAQRDWLDALARCPGVESYVIRPSDWALLDALLA